MTLEPLDFPETFHEGVAQPAPLERTHPADPLVAALNRVAAALETYNRSQGPLGAVEAPRAAALAPLPPIGQAQQTGGCPVHNQAWKYVPAGVSKKTGASYDAFYSCPVRGCTQRPPR